MRSFYTTSVTGPSAVTTTDPPATSNQSRNMDFFLQGTNVSTNF